MVGLRRWAWALGYGLMVALGGYGLWAASGPVVTSAAALGAMIGAVGLVVVSFIAGYDRRRPPAALAVAPSGTPALFFRRSPFIVVCSVLFTLGFAGWTGAVAVQLHQHGHDLVAVPVGGLALVLLWPVVAAARGKVAPGGLWVTPAGLEHRQEAVSWAVPWQDVTGAEPYATRNVLPYLPGHGLVPVQPVLLDLQTGRYPVKRHTVRWVWSREIRLAGADVVVVDAYDLAGGAGQLAETIRHYLAHPGLRAQLGTARSLPRGDTGRDTGRAEGQNSV